MNGHRRGAWAEAFPVTLQLLAVTAFLALAAVLGGSESDELLELATLGALCSVCWSTPSAETARFARRARLTQRELQVVRCTATGSTNREIAQHLGVSVRTVEGHLLRACEKLGVRGRVRIALLVHAVVPWE